MCVCVCTNSGVAGLVRGFAGVFAAGWRPGMANSANTNTNTDQDSNGGGTGVYSLYGFRDTSVVDDAPRPAEPLML